MGTSSGSDTKSKMVKDHPHAYGDKTSTANVQKSTSGSSPRVWGQDSSGTLFIVNDRIIPTRMGTSDFLQYKVIVNRDHPHAYGDKEMFTSRFIVYIGSSPRVWGQVDININAQKTPRIIPTRMGTRL